MNKGLRKKLAILLSLALMLSGFPVARAQADTEPYWTDSGNYEAVSGGNITITSPSQLAGLAVKVNSGTDYSGYTVTLGNDIDLSAYLWTPIGIDNSHKFKGNFNGNNHAITGMRIVKTAFDQEYAGLFGGVEGSTIQNLTVSGTINLTTDSSGDKAIFVGGLVGHAYNETISGCLSNVDITTSYNRTGEGIIGGLIGQAYIYQATCRINGCKASGDLSVTASDNSATIRAGGLCGSTYAPEGETIIFNSCSASGTVCTTSNLKVGTAYLGGFIGQALYSNIINSHASGAVNTASSVTGSSIGILHAGGFAGENSLVSVIDNCYATASVSLAATISSAADAGGFVGQLKDLSEIKNCYSTGAVTATSGTCQLSGFAGRVTDYLLQDCYYAYQAYAASTSGCAVTAANTMERFYGLTPAQLNSSAVLDNTYENSNKSYTWNYMGDYLVTALNKAKTKLVTGGFASNLSSWVADTTYTVNNGYPTMGTPITAIAVTGSAIVTEGLTSQMTATITPAGATYPSVSWSVSNGTGSATISSTGLLTATSAGTVTVTATAKDGSGISGNATVTVTVPPTNNTTTPPVTYPTTNDTVKQDVVVKGTATSVNGNTEYRASITAAQADASTVGKAVVNLGTVTVTLPVAVLDDALGNGTSLNLTQSEAPAATRAAAEASAQQAQGIALAVLDINLNREVSGNTEAVHNLTGEVTVTISLTPEQVAAITQAIAEGKNAYIYYYDPQTDSLTDMKAVFDLNAKTATFYTKHFSSYVLAVSNSALSGSDNASPVIKMVDSKQAVIKNKGISANNVTVTISGVTGSAITVTRNGKAYSLPLDNRFTKDGKYVVTVKTPLGKAITKVFTIDKTAPVVTSKTNKKGTKISIKENNLSSKTITLNGKKIAWPKDNTFTKKGAYVITVTDQAKHRTKYKFKI